MLLASNNGARQRRDSTMVTIVQPAPLPLTGERTLPGIHSENYWFRRHEACYAWAAARLTSNLSSAMADRPIMDAGSGEGYGSALLAGHTGRPVIAAELDSASADHAHRTYPDVLSLRANLVSMPLRQHACSAAVSFQVIEHVWDVPAYLHELLRCTSGPIALSTPNRLVHSPGLARGARPINPFHEREFDPEELMDELSAAAPGRDVVVFGLHHGPRIAQWETAHGSLCGQLLGSDVQARTRAELFAADITCADFDIRASDVEFSQDLVVWWG